MSTVEKLPDFNNDDEDWDFNLDEVEVATFGTKEYLDETREEIKNFRERQREIKSELQKKYPNADRYKRLSKDSKIRSGDNAFVKDLLNEYNEIRNSIKLKNVRLREAEEVFRSNLGIKNKDARHGMHAVPDLSDSEKHDQIIAETEEILERAERKLDRKDKKEKVRKEQDVRSVDNSDIDVLDTEEIAGEPEEINDETIEFEVPMHLVNHARNSFESEKKDEIAGEGLGGEDSAQKQEVVNEGNFEDDRFNFNQVDSIINNIPSMRQVAKLEEERRMLPKEIAALDAARSKLEAGKKNSRPGFFGRLFDQPDMSKYKTVSEIDKAELELPDRLKSLPLIIKEQNRLISLSHKIYTDMNRRYDHLNLKKNKSVDDWQEIEKLKKYIETLGEAIRNGSEIELKNAA